jgi:hypothetical protein
MNQARAGLFILQEIGYTSRMCIVADWRDLMWFAEGCCGFLLSFS